MYIIVRLLLSMREYFHVRLDGVLVSVFCLGHVIDVPLLVVIHQQKFIQDSFAHTMQEIFAHL